MHLTQRVTQCCAAAAAFDQSTCRLLVYFRTGSTLALGVDCRLGHDPKMLAVPKFRELISRLDRRT